MDSEIACPHCKEKMTVQPESRGLVIHCPHCQQTLTVADAPMILACPRCGGHSLTKARQKFSTAGALTCVAGVCLLPAYGAGLILICIAYSMREWKYGCNRCQLWF
jgi:DNA-directed RNA polymerase subunit RPC12/RpoP